MSVYVQSRDLRKVMHRMVTRVTNHIYHELDIKNDAANKWQTQPNRRKKQKSKITAKMIPVGIPLLTWTPAFFMQKTAVHLALLKWHI